MQGFKEYLVAKGAGDDRASSALGNAEDLERYMALAGIDATNLSRAALDGYLARLISEGRNGPERLVDIARYFAYRSRPDLFIYLATMINSYDVLPLMERRLGELYGNDRREAVFHDLVMPPLGAPTDAYPPLTAKVLHRLEVELSPEQVRALLIWNYHEIPRESFQAKKERYRASADLDAFLASEHQRLIEELKERLRNGQPWYEQEVTPEFVDQVISDQRLQTGTREGNRIICVKVPFDPKNYYRETDPQLRRYHYCHCPLARSALLGKGSLPSPSLCHCSAGFTKLPWDVLFGEETEVEVLETVLGGGDRCMFSIRIPEGRMK